MTPPILGGPLLISSPSLSAVINNRIKRCLSWNMKNKNTCENLWKYMCTDSDRMTDWSGQKENKNNKWFSPDEICIMKFSYHEIFLFLFKVQRILSKHLQSPSGTKKRTRPMTGYSEWEFDFGKSCCWDLKGTLRVCWQVWDGRARLDNKY